MRIRLPLRAGVAALLACAVLAGQAASLEDVQRIKNQSAIPRWKDAAIRAQALRLAPIDPKLGASWNALDQETDPAIGKAPLQQATTSQNSNGLLANASWLRWKALTRWLPWV